jgi:hypothetical protein
MLNEFLNKEVFSVNDFEHNYESYSEEIMEDRNMYTGKRYSNIFELRHVKNKFLIETMPTLVKNYCLITHDDLINNFINIMNKIKNHNLQIKKSIIDFPLNISYYKKEKNTLFDKTNKKTNIIKKEIIIKKANLFYEKILFPDLEF